MLGVLVNTCTVIIGSIAGLLFKKGLPQKYATAVMTGIGLCTIAIGISGILEGTNALILIISIVVGSVIGTLLDIDKRLNGLGKRLEKRFETSGGSSSIAQGFVTASLLFCVGSMTIVGSLNAGLSGDNELLFTKSLLDLVSAVILTVSLGIGVLFSAAFVFAFQGAIVVLSQFLQPVLSSGAIAEITCTGSLLIVALGFNLIGITKIKVANFLPAIFMAPLVYWIFALIQ